MQTVHATTIAIDGQGVMLRGPSGSGKSDLALRLIDDGARLVADDQTEIEARDGRLIARAPARLAGLLEVRGVGIVPVDAVDRVEVALIAEMASQSEIQRLPDEGRAAVSVAGVSLPSIRLEPFQASAPAKLRIALKHGVGTAP